MTLGFRALASFRTFPMHRATWFVKFLPQRGDVFSIVRRTQRVNALRGRREAAQLSWDARAGGSLFLEWRL